MARIIGIDIDDHSIKAVLLRSSLRSHEFVAFEEISLPNEFSDEQSKKEAINNALQNLASRFGADYDWVVVDISGQLASMRTLSLPRVAQRHLSEVVPNELEGIIPFDSEDIVHDHQSVPSSDDSLHVLVAALPRLVLAERINLFSHNGLSPREIAVGAASLDGLCAVVPELKGPEPVVMIEFRSQCTDVCVVQQGHCLFARTLSMGVRGQNQNAEALAKELKQTLYGYRASGAPLPVQVYITGEGSTLPGAEKWVSDLLHLPTMLLPLPIPASPTEAEPAGFARAAALAARVLGRGKRINLRTGEFSPERATNILREKAGLLVACGVVVVLAFAVSSFGRLQLLEKRNVSLKAELAKITTSVFGEETSNPVTARELLEGGGHDKDPLPKVRAFELLETVSNAVPSGVAHDTRQLRIELGIGGGRGRLELEGILNNNSERAKIVANLEKHHCIKELNEAGTFPAGDGRIRYKIEAEIDCPGASPTKKGEKK